MAMQIPQAYVLRPDEDKTPEENIEKIMNFIKGMVENGSDYEIELRCFDGKEIDPMEMSDLLVEAHKNLEIIEADPKLRKLFGYDKEE